MDARDSRRAIPEVVILRTSGCSESFGRVFIDMQRNRRLAGACRVGELGILDSN